MDFNGQSPGIQFVTLTMELTRHLMCVLVRVAHSFEYWIESMARFQSPARTNFVDILRRCIKEKRKNDFATNKSLVQVSSDVPFHLKKIVSFNKKFDYCCNVSGRHTIISHYLLSLILFFTIFYVSIIMNNCH